MKNVDVIMRILKKEVKKFENPLITQVSDKTRDPFQVLISCILSLRTKDETTAKASERLFKRARTPKTILKLKEKEIEKLIYPVGFYKVKTKTIKSICRKLIEEYNGKVPETIDELLKFKGVGRKTANIVLTFGHNNKDGLAIDIHCFRIPNRIGWVKTKTPEETEFVLRKKLPKKHWWDFNNIFVVFGQNICVPVSPKCSICPIERYCQKIGVIKHR